MDRTYEFSERQRWWFLSILFLVSVSQFFDRNVISVLLEPIKREFQVSDAKLGLLGGLCFALFYALAGVPLARWADRGNRRAVITFALTVWSLMTVLCGLAQNFWQLALARVGVGAGEAGGLPPSQALIVDYFPPKQRATALAILTGGAIAGSALGIGVGGYIAARHGWRSVMLGAGVAGLVLAGLVWFALMEPRVGRKSANQTVPAETWSATFVVLRRKRSYVYALLGSLLYFLFSYGALIFVPSFLGRVLHASLTDVSVMYGSAVAAGSLAGTVGGGWLADRLGQRDVGWLAWLPAIAFALASPVFIISLSLHELMTFIALAFAVNLALCAGIPSMFAAVHVVCGSARRATAVAIVYFSANLLGAGFGPVLSGWLSDALGVTYGTDGLRYSLMIMAGLLPVSSLLLYQTGRTMPSDRED